MKITVSFVSSPASPHPSFSSQLALTVVVPPEIALTVGYQSNLSSFVQCLFAVEQMADDVQLEPRSFDDRVYDELEPERGFRVLGRGSRIQNEASRCVAAWCRRAAR